MHANSVRAGYVDLNGCLIVDLLPRSVDVIIVSKHSTRPLTRHSNFIPTCSGCSNPYPAPGLVSIRGDSSMAMCRVCHHSLSTLTASWRKDFLATDVRFHQY